MVPSFVILKGEDGRPVKGVFLAAQDNEIVVCDPARFREVKSGTQSISRVSRAAVFHFEENAFKQLTIEWETSKQTTSEIWSRLGNVLCGSSLREAA
jgi:hypothetical protein